MGASFKKPNREIFDKLFLQKYNALSSIYATYLPNNITEVFKWINFIMANIPKVQSAVDKFSSVAITSLIYSGNSKEEENTKNPDEWKEILENDLKIKTILKELAFNYILYGNLFVSVNFPIVRTLECMNCHSMITEGFVEDDTTLVPFLKKIKGKETLLLKGKCPSCHAETTFRMKDALLKNPKKIKIINWNINHIDLYEDAITGIKTFYYTPTDAESELINKGFKEKIFHTPVDIIKAVLKKGKVKFNEDKILHVRAKKFNATHTAWGIPKLTSAIPDMVSLLLLRKSNEKIYTDMIFPFRGLTPRVSGVDNNSMYAFVDGAQMKNKISQSIKAWKNDPTSIQFFPVPVEPFSLFGEGKALNLSQEIESFTNMILSSLGIPNEFISGGLAYNGSSVSLRILQNELIETVNGLEEITNFIAQKLAYFLSKSTVRIKLVPLKLIDDAQEKQLILSLLQANKVSAHTALNIFGLNHDEEREKIVEEQKQSIEDQLEVQNYQQEVSTSIEDKIKQESMMENSNVWNLNQQAILQQADTMVQQISQLPYGAKKSKLDELEKDNQVLYAVVKWRLEFLNQKQGTQAKYQQ